MKILKTLLFFMFVLHMAGAAQDNKGSLVGITEFTVKPGHHAGFVAGVKAWKECYQKNKGTDHWAFWQRVQGRGDVFVLTGEMANWAEMDKKDEAGGACRATAISLIQPHLESVETTIAWELPKYSQTMGNDIKIVYVTYFRVKNGADFMDVVKGNAEAQKKIQGRYSGVWNHVIGGGPDAPNYFVVDPAKSFADFDQQQDSAWEIYEKANGKKAADEHMAKARNSVEKVWSYIYTLNEELSN